MAQQVCVILSTAEREQLAVIAADRNRPCKHVERARIVLASADRGQYIYFEGATSGTFWRFKAPYPGLIGPGGVRLPAQP